MGYVVTHRLGSMKNNPPLESLAALAAELDAADDQHFDVSVSDDSGWTLTAYANGSIVWENVETDGALRHLPAVARNEVIRMMKAVATGDLAALEREQWQAGYPR
ncbi:MAG: hypothetical protein JWN44_2813 [Myxococcales bacterium]|nr:hypothetical protein [Myxococcales bacterium]